MTERYEAAGCSLRLGRWEDVLQDVTCDSLIVDAPYSERTHASHNAGADDANRGADYRGRVAKPTGGTGPRRALSYDRWSPEHVAAFCAAWSGRCAGWFVSITDHVLAPTWESALKALGRYVFAPIPFVETGSRVRLSGDGPSSWTCWVIVARPQTREFQRWGTLPGSYIDTAERKPVVGGKPLGLMRALVRDYTRPGDLVCDPAAGAATTLLAALMEGRRAVGAEALRAHFDIGVRRLARGFTPTLFADAPRTAPEQLKIGGDE